MAHIVHRIVLTPSEAAEKALIVEQLRTTPRSPWMNGKKTSLPASRAITPQNDKKK